MYTLGIPKSQYRRTTQVLGYESSTPIPYDAAKQDDGFYIFSFPGADESQFREIVRLLKVNGVNTIGADDQLTEKQMMKLVDILKEQNLSSETMQQGEYTAIEQGWDGLTSEEHKNILVDLEINPAEADYKDFDQLKAENDDFEAGVANYLGIDEGSCGYSIDGKPANKPAGPDLIRKAIRNEIKKLAKETSLDDKLRGALGDKDFEKVINKPVPSLADMIKSKPVKDKK